MIVLVLLLWISSAFVEVTGSKTLYPYKLWIKAVTSPFCKQKYVFCILPTYPFATGQRQCWPTTPVPLWAKWHSSALPNVERVCPLKQRRVIERESCGVFSSTPAPLYQKDMGFAPLEGHFSCHLHCTPGSSHTVLTGHEFFQDNTVSWSGQCATYCRWQEGLVTTFTSGFFQCQSALQSSFWRLGSCAVPCV